MGRLVADHVLACGQSLCGGTTRSASPSGPWPHYPTPLELACACDVVIDFTHPDAVPAHADAMCAGGAAWILGTTGLSESDREAVHRAASEVAIVQAPNFSPGVNLVLALAERLARALPADEYDAEIIEMHHRDKRDAPSGTALAIGEAVAAGRGVRLADTAEPARHGQTGPRAPGAIGFASLRGGAVVGDHTLLFAADGEQISLSHRALDRAAFARGAVRAAIWAGPGRKPGLYGMRDVLGMRDDEQ
jgi:4-hydroxy-tetrahydrodipicolinate reductase